MSRTALAAGVTLAPFLSAGAAELTAEMTRVQSAQTPGAVTSLETDRQTALQNRAIALRAQWLARGHSVQQLAGTAPPAITGGSVTASTITVGQAGQFPSLSLSYTTDTPGLNFVSVEFVSPNGKTAYGGGYGTYYYTKSGTVSFAIVAALSLYASPGEWTIAGATIVDNAGNSKTYTAQQLKALFTGRSFTVVNSGPMVKAAPLIVGGHLRNTTVSESARFPVLAATITARDRNGPGIYIAWVQIQPPGQTYSFYSYLPNPTPVKGGKINANNVFNTSYPTGTWNILGYGVCDFAFNCSGSTSDSDVVALFGTDTFTVTP